MLTQANREHWNLAGTIIDQSKIKWAIHNFKPFKLRTEDTVHALLYNGVEYLCSFLEPVKHMDTFLDFRHRLK
jgi:hypothetical protein